MKRLIETIQDWVAEGAALLEKIHKEGGQITREC